MKPKTIILPPLFAILMAMILNGLFHVVFAASFFDNAFTTFGNNVRSIKETNPLLLLVVESTWVISLFYFLTMSKPGKIKLQHAIIGGMLINAVASGTWNFINLSMFNVYPAGIILPDMAWHILIIGPLAGLAIAYSYNKLGAAKQIPLY